VYKVWTGFRRPKETIPEFHNPFSNRQHWRGMVEDNRLGMFFETFDLYFNIFR
jgi:hypothetical protein